MYCSREECDAGRPRAKGDGCTTSRSFLEALAAWQLSPNIYGLQVPSGAGLRYYSPYFVLSRGRVCMVTSNIVNLYFVAVEMIYPAMCAVQALPRVVLEAAAYSR